MTDAWRIDLAAARQQGAHPSRQQRVWDAKWCRWLDVFTGRGGTPNAAVPFAYRKTLDQLGARPGPHPDGSDAQETP